MVKKAAKTNGLFEEIAGDAKPRVVDAASLPNTKVMSQVAQLYAEATDIEAQIAKRNEANTADAERLRKIYEERIPSVMNAAQVRGFTMMDGTVVEVEPFHYGDFVAEKKPDAFKWLRANKHGDLIKEEVKVAAGRGTGKAVKEVMALCKRLGLTAEKSENVHTQTLRAFVREQMKKGVSLPEKLFRIHSGQRATFKAPKASTQEKK